MPSSAPESTTPEIGTAGGQLLAAIVAGSHDAIFASDLKGRVISWNPAAQTLFGYEACEVLGHDVVEFIPFDKDCLQQDVLERVRSGQHVDHYQTLRLGKDGGLRAISLTASPLHDQLGIITGACMIIRDISERIELEAEKERVRVALEMSHQTIVHDLRGPVGMARSLMLEAVAKMGDADSTCLRYLDLASNCLGQTQRLLDDVALLFQVCDESERQPLDIRTVVERVAAGIPAARVTFGDLPDQPLGHEPALAQIVRNILENATRYAPGEDGVADVRISGSSRLTDWCLDFDDQGPGIAPDEMSKIFEPYYRGVAVGGPSGTGLGLAIVEAGTRAHGGTASVTNRAGGGLRVSTTYAL
ncbi:MAG: bvgS 1 [Thermoleophilia bacterium]|nr:bvgS 1 [Thermoleophilia bacterium]